MGLIFVEYVERMSDCIKEGRYMQDFRKNGQLLSTHFLSYSSLEEKRVLVKDKYYILFKPVLYVLNKVEAITKTPTSPMEIWFHGKYGKFIQDMMVRIFLFYVLEL